MLAWSVTPGRFFQLQLQQPPPLSAHASPPPPPPHPVADHTPIAPPPAPPRTRPYHWGGGGGAGNARRLTIYTRVALRLHHTLSNADEHILRPVLYRYKD